MRPRRKALLQRQALDGSLDMDESRKALRFLTKVMLVRQASTLEPAVTLDSVSAEVTRELAFAAAQQLPSSARELAEPIAAWLFFPALAAVHRYGAGDAEYLLLTPEPA